MKSIAIWAFMVFLCGALSATQTTPLKETKQPTIKYIKKLDPKPNCVHLQSHKQKKPSSTLSDIKVSPVTSGKVWRPPQCRPSKPATMETDAMRRAKVRHRGLPIEGCAPLSPKEHNHRFHAAIQKEKAK